jgi:hypothetical protein
MEHTLIFGEFPSRDKTEFGGEVPEAERSAGSSVRCGGNVNQPAP